MKNKGLRFAGCPLFFAWAALLLGEQKLAAQQQRRKEPKAPFVPLQKYREKAMRPPPILS